MQMASKELEIKEDAKVAEECKALMATEEELAENDAKVLLPLMEKFSHSYDQKAEGVSDIDWLKGTLKEELPEKSDEEINKRAEEIITSLEKLRISHTAINEYCDNGGSKEQWLSERISEACTGMEVVKFGGYLSEIDAVLAENNALMADAITLKGTNIISQNPNLHGFIAEQYHVNTFNSNAVLKGEPYRAEVVNNVHGYAKNSPDIVIKDMSNRGKIIERYQAKYGKDAKATSDLIRKGNYNNQRVLAAKGQAEDVAANLKTKSVSDRIGGNVKTKGITSKPLTKEEALKMQRAAQEKGRIPGKETWNSYSTKQLARDIGTRAAFAGVSAAALTVGIDTAIKVIQGKKIDPSETMKIAVYTGADTGAKVTTAAAIEVGMQKGMLKILPKTINGVGIAIIADVAIENAKIAYKVVKGEMTLTQGMDAAGRVSCSSIGAAVGAIELGAEAALTAALVISNPVAVLAVGVGGMICGAMAGAAVGRTIYNGAKSIAKGAVNCVKKFGSAVKSSISKVGNFLFG